MLIAGRMLDQSVKQQIQNYAFTTTQRLQLAQKCGTEDRPKVQQSKNNKQLQLYIYI